MQARHGELANGHCGRVAAAGRGPQRRRPGARRRPALTTAAAALTATHRRRLGSATRLLLCCTCLLALREAGDTELSVSGGRTLGAQAALSALHRHPSAPEALQARRASHRRSLHVAGCSAGVPAPATNPGDLLECTGTGERSGEHGSGTDWVALPAVPAVQAASMSLLALAGALHMLGDVWQVMATSGACGEPRQGATPCPPSHSPWGLASGLASVHTPASWTPCTQIKRNSITEGRHYQGCPAAPAAAAAGLCAAAVSTLRGAHYTCVSARVASRDIGGIVAGGKGLPI